MNSNQGGTIYGASVAQRESMNMIRGEPIGLPSGQVEAQMPQLARTSERLYACIAELDGLVAKLESALDPVLNPPSPVGAGSTATPDPVRCPIGRSMDARSDEVCAITARVRSLLDRLAC